MPAFVQYKVTTKELTSGADALVLDAPTSIVENNLLIAYMDTRRSSAADPTVTAPGGWTILAQLPVGSVLSQHVYAWKKVSSWEGLRYRFEEFNNLVNMIDIGVIVE